MSKRWYVNIIDVWISKYCLFRLVLTLEIINVWTLITDFVFYHLVTKYTCEPSKMLQLVDSPIQDLVCKKSIIELRVECPKSNKNCLRYVEKAKCYIDQKESTVIIVDFRSKINIIFGYLTL